MRLAPIIGVLLFMAATAPGATITVPDDYPTIQGAITAAVTGDKIIVRPGTYVENIDFQGKGVVVRSEHRAHMTVIDGARLGPVVTFGSGEVHNSILDGFTITNGSASCGGGINCLDSSPTIAYCIIQNNEAIGDPGKGGGISCTNGSPIITANMIFGNTAENKGGGIACDNSSATVTSNTIYGNTQTGTTCGGGGIYVAEGSVLAVANTILWSNTAIAGNEIYVGDTLNPSTLDISYSDVLGGEPLVYVDTGCTLNWGSGMIDDDPLFVEPDAGDLHIPYTSPCMDTGDTAAPFLGYKDFEGDSRVVGVTVDIGADEFCSHLYCAGDVVPGGPIEIRVAGLPTITDVRLVQGSGIKNPPTPTIYGNVYLERPLLGAFKLGPMDPTGVLRMPATVPAGWIPGDEFYFQALVGPLGNPDTTLTNLLILIVQ